MAEDEIISATDASRAFSDLLHKVCYGGQSFVIKKGNRLMARIAPVEALAEAPQVAMQSISDPIAELIESISLPPNLSQEEAEYFLAVLEEQRKSESA